MSDDFYAALGVSRGADLNKIKKAYREVVKKYHPDATGSTDTVERFLEVREAYETLGDETRRKRYDRRQREEPSPIMMERRVEIIRHRRSLFDEMEKHFCSTDDFFEGMVRGFSDLGRGRARGKDLYLEAVLSPEEAQTGGLFPISVPVIEPCPRCLKTGYVDTMFCPVCSGVGRVTSERTFSLSIPPHVRHGTELSLSMEGIGLKDAHIHIRVFIDPFL